jgi:lambda family phage portal protein
MISLYEHLYNEPMGRIIQERADLLAKAREGKRRYAGAKINRLNSNWVTSPTSANYELRQSISILRARARMMARDNSHFKKFLSMCRSNIIGPKGLQLQSRARMQRGGALDAKLNKRVEEAWWQWAHKNTCTASGKLDFVRVQNLCVTQLARDGEVLIQLVNADNAFGFSLKLINCDYLDETYNETRPDGNRVIMSVEVDANDRPVAYWLTTPPSDINFTQRKERERVRVPAEQMIHAFLIYDDEAQVRGVTWFHAALMDAKNLHGYKEGVIIASRIGANQLGFIEQDAPDDMSGFIGEDGEPITPVIDVSPGSFNLLNPGQKIAQFKPDQPTQNHPAFYKSMLMDLSTGLDVFYFNLSGDMEAVNYSSARVGLREERDIWEGLQDFVSEMICTPIFHAWVKSSWISGALTLNQREFAEIQNPLWRGRGWAYVDPQKEVAADRMALESGLTTYTDVLAAKGVDFLTHLETLKQERAEMKRMDIELTPAEVAGAPAAPDGGGSEMEEIKREADAYGVGVRAGTITPQTDDEEYFRTRFGLPKMSAEAKDAWKKDKGTRRPITLAQADGSHPGAAPTAGADDGADETLKE